MDRFVYVDTETTDKTPGQIAQMAFITADDDAIVEARNFYFSVGLMSPGAEAIHHLSKAVLSALSANHCFGDYVTDYIDAFFSDRTFVAHNVNFDLMFLKMEMFRCGLVYEPPQIVCTMKRLTPVCKIKGMYGHFKWPRVEEALQAVKIPRQEVLIKARHLFQPTEVQSPQGALLGFHDARYDVTAVYLLHQWMRENRK